MEMQKECSKGSFFSLFDWNSKSRKKLLWNNPNLPEGSKHGKENLESMPMVQTNRIKVDKNGASSSNIVSSDFSCALSVNSDEGYGSKAPGLVARLMGLDSLPTSEVTEHSSTSLYGSNAHSAYHCRENALYSKDNFRHVDYRNVLLKVKSSCDAMESKAQKVGNCPIKRFQTEMLPPSSAKPIPVTHNKLLSPIKSPSFLTPKNAAHIMEAASKIIDASPRPYMRNKMASVGPSSVPLRILDLKERLEASQFVAIPEKSVYPRTANLANGKPGERNSNLYKYAPALNGSRDSGKTSCRNLASKGKSVPHSIRSQTNVQSRDTVTANGNKKYLKQKGLAEIKSTHFSRSEKPSAQRGMQQRTGRSRDSNVLGQNNQKQNSLTNKGKSTSKIDFTKPTTQTSSSESSTRIRKTKNKGAVNTKIQPKRSSTRATNFQKEIPPFDSTSKNKKYMSRDVLEARGQDKAVNNFERKSIKCNITTDGIIEEDAFSMNESNDVISFTFTSPLRRSMPESLSFAEQVVESRNGTGVDSFGHNDNHYPKKLSFSPPGLPMINGDSLSDLLEKKLQELTSRMDLPQCTLATEESSADSRSYLQDQVPSVVSPMSVEQGGSFHPYLFSDKLDNMHDWHYSNDDPAFHMNPQFQKAMEDPSCSGNSDNGYDRSCQHPRAVTVFESPSVSESYMDSEDSAYGSTVYSYMQDEEVSNFSDINESVSLEKEASSAQSSSVLGDENMAVKQLREITNLEDFKRSRYMGLEYVHDILTNAEFIAEEYVIGQINTIIMPNIFDRLENQINGAENCQECSKLERKVVFDFVSECLELRCRRAFIGTCKEWPRWEISFQRKSVLAEELYRQMLGFVNMEEEVMVDELVNNDMSTGCGRWLDFDAEAFEEGLEVEQEIVDSLVNELVSDLLHV
ncbi:hypothetical protein TanjilG_22253 [Lupinus angustifolius]|uniref:DUF4378 domain-containing protein n=1 Tax=Lupinus angustifolius TaxID=3871 RepID=A0A1J7HKV6_LUPAN|nr:PREDICTED: uncharacterized protein LOC109345840 [Lupinus angustifolius]OIW13462.1 hypothetical protein TanjilG_22253 [Lupinus angustifolius]